MRGRLTDYLQNGILMEWKWVKHPIISFSLWQR